jgi:hypothetical protein
MKNIYIIDSTKRWSDANVETGLIEEGTEGGKLKKLLCESGFQIINGVCLYVKRFRIYIFFRIK